MANFTSNTYQMKRKISSFSNKISRNLSKHLAKRTPKDALIAYLVQAQKNGVPIKLSSISMTVMS